jgi:hypothetical protein
MLIALFALTTTVKGQQTKNGENTTGNLTMIAFEGEFDEKFIALKWSPIEKPELVKKYLIEYSKDGNEYKQIGSIVPNEANVYTFQSIAYQAGRNHFRIIQVDKNNVQRISEHINVMCGFPDRYTLDIKNEDNQLKMKLQVRNEQRVVAEILNSKGEVVKSIFQGNLEANEMIFREIHISEINSESHYLSIRGEYFRLSTEISIEK